MSKVGYEDIVEQVKNSYDIIDVIGRYVVLKRAGSNYKGLCPFHNEKTPSFMVSQEKQIFTCFGCGATGDVISFVQRHENLEFMEAVEKLAEEAGIEIRKNVRGTEKKKEELYEVSRLAARHFYKNLRQGANEGLKYVVARGISPETAAKFGIGYAKGEWQDLTGFFQKKGASEELGFEAGLFAKNKNGGTYDKFRNRVIFPILNTRDKVIGFGGRAIDDSTPKYLNSAESAIFKKKDNLYGLNLAKNAIRKANLAILVEGYMDVVSLADAGVENVVATLGTALTAEQAKLLKRYTDTVVLSYDSDGAGQNATMRGIDILKEAGCRVRILQLDEGKDPDEYIRKNGKESFEKLVNQAISYMEYKIIGIKKKFDINTTDGSIRFLEEVSAELRKVRSPVEQAAYIRQISEMMKIPESSLRREIDQGGGGTQQTETQQERRQERKEQREETGAVVDSGKAPVVKTLIKLMLANGKFIPIIAGNDEISNFFYGSGYERILEQIVMHYSDDGEVDIGMVREALAEEDLPLLQDIVTNLLPVNEEEKTLLQCAKRIKLYYLKKRHKQIMKIMEILDEEEDKAQIEKLSEEIMDIGNMIKTINERKG